MWFWSKALYCEQEDGIMTKYLSYFSYKGSPSYQNNSWDKNCGRWQNLFKRWELDQPFPWTWGSTGLGVCHCAIFFPLFSHFSPHLIYLFPSIPAHLKTEQDKTIWIGQYVWDYTGSHHRDLAGLQGCLSIAKGFADLVSIVIVLRIQDVIGVLSHHPRRWPPIPSPHTWPWYLSCRLAPIQYPNHLGLSLSQQQSEFIELGHGLYCQLDVSGCHCQALSLCRWYRNHQELSDGLRKPWRKLVDDLLEGMDVLEELHVPGWDRILSDRDSL